jgi:hypothetical protein
MAQAPIGKADRERLDAALPKLCELLRGANFLEVAAKSLRLDPTRVRARLRLAQEDGADPSDVDWASSVEAARSGAVVELVGEVRVGVLSSKSGGPDWKARAWLLEKLAPRLYGPKAGEDESVAVGKPSIEIVTSGGRVMLDLGPTPSADAKLVDAA